MEFNVRVKDQSTGAPVGGALVLINAYPKADFAAKSGAINPSTRLTDGGGVANFVAGLDGGFASPLLVDITVIAAGFQPWTTGGTPQELGSASVEVDAALVPFERAARVTPRRYRGNMCGVRVPGLPPIEGGAADPSLVLSWFYDRYTPADRARIRAAWRAAGCVDVLLSWPDARAVKPTAAQFADICGELTDAGFLPVVMGCSKDVDPANVDLIFNSIMRVLPLLIARRVIARLCVGWELSLWLSPAQVQDLTDRLVPVVRPAGVPLYVHFQEGYFAFQVNGKTTGDYWRANVGKLAGVFHQRDLSWDMPMYQARITDCLERFAGGAGCPADNGDGHPFDFIALEITAELQFNGQMSTDDGNAWGTCALTTPAVNGPLGPVAVMGSGNGQL